MLQEVFQTAMVDALAKPEVSNGVRKISKSCKPWITGIFMLVPTELSPKPIPNPLSSCLCAAFFLVRGPTGRS